MVVVPIGVLIALVVGVLMGDLTVKEGITAIAAVATAAVAFAATWN
jgi:hypothetical protein